MSCFVKARYYKGCGERGKMGATGPDGDPGLPGEQGATGPDGVPGGTGITAAARHGFLTSGSLVMDSQESEPKSIKFPVLNPDGTIPLNGPSFAQVGTFNQLDLNISLDNPNTFLNGTTGTWFYALNALNSYKGFMNCTLSVQVPPLANYFTKYSSVLEMEAFMYKINSPLSFDPTQVYDANAIGPKTKFTVRGRSGYNSTIMVSGFNDDPAVNDDNIGILFRLLRFNGDQSDWYDLPAANPTIETGISVVSLNPTYYYWN